MPTICDHENTTSPFCPSCGARLTQDSPTEELLFYLRIQQKKRHNALEKTEGRLEWRKKQFEKQEQELTDEDRKTWERNLEWRAERIEKDKKLLDQWNARIGSLVELIAKVEGKDE